MEQNLNWHQITYEPEDLTLPSKRWGHKTVFVDDQILLFGGFSDVTYLSDLWAYNIHTNKWREVKTTGTKPEGKSNFTMHFDQVTNQLLIFGGGGPNKRRFSKVSLLNWKSKEWSEVDGELENESSGPWQRTYHSSEFKYPFLITFGGEGTGNVDLDDLWVFNIETRKWTEIITRAGKAPSGQGKTSRPKIEGRKFHSTTMIESQFYVISGCKMNYTCIPSIYSIDLKVLFEGVGSIEVNSIEHNTIGKETVLEWKLHKIPETQLAFIEKWGHSSQTYNNKIYIFGGRNQQDSNDLFEFNPQTDTITKLSLSPNNKLPKSRRRHSSCMNGSSMVIFGGFNQDYFNDLQYISLFACRDTLNSDKYMDEEDEEIIELESSMFWHFMQEMDKNKLQYDLEIFLEPTKAKEPIVVKSVSTILAKRSAYFNNCLLHNQSSNPQRNTLTLPLSSLNITALSFQIFNTFLLKDLLIMPRGYKLIHLWQLLICADYFQVPSLFNLIEKLLTIRVIEQKQNVQDVFNVSANWNMTSLLKVCAEKKVMENAYFSTYSRLVGISYAAARLKEKHIEEVLIEIRFDEIQKGQKRRTRTFRQFGKNIKQYNLVAEEKGLVRPATNKRKKSFVYKFVESLSKFCTNTELYKNQQRSFEYEEEEDSEELEGNEIKMFEIEGNHS